jgi:FAD synthetase
MGPVTGPRIGRRRQSREDPRPAGSDTLAGMAKAGVLVIGNEILSGKVVDANSPYLCRELRELGVEVERILTIPDDTSLIAREVRTMSDVYDWVFTSGGIGPTHDDLTMEGIGAAFGLPLELNESISARIERALGAPLNASQRKMAMLPKGARLIDSGDLWFPVVIVENVHIFPGIPELLRRKFESIRERFRGVPFVLKRVYVKRRESEIAETLHGLLARFPGLMLGSYPRVGEEAFHVLLTLESRDAGYVQRALDALLDQLSPDAVHKVE